MHKSFFLEDRTRWVNRIFCRRWDNIFFIGGHAAWLDKDRLCLIWGLKFECEYAFEARFATISTEVTLEKGVVESVTLFGWSFEGGVLFFP